jgi:hypothetical protein
MRLEHDVKLVITLDTPAEIEAFKHVVNMSAFIPDYEYEIRDLDKRMVEHVMDKLHELLVSEGFYDFSDD